MGSYPVVSIHLQDVDPKAIEKYAKMTDQEAEMEAEAPVDEEGMDEGDMLATAAGLK
jgi:pyruvate-formate lyase-activating enzyme